MKRSLGIGFSGSKIYFTELSGTGEIVKAENIESVKVDFDFENELGKYKSSQKDLTNISSEISTYIAKRNLEVTSAGLTISSSQAFIITLPVDFTEGKQTINSRIYWELSNYFPDNYNDFLVNTYRLNNVLPSKLSDDFLVIAVPKNTIEFVKRIFKICSLDLNVVDIDHFSAENSLRFILKEKITGSNILLTGIKNGRIDYGYLQNGKYKFYTYSRYYNETEFNLNLIRKLNSIINNELIAGKVDGIYFYGDDIKEDTFSALEKNDLGPFMLLNPFECFTASEVFLKNSTLRKNFYSFAPGCGVALRNIQS
ncbi:MAG: Competence protein A [Chlorobi bacterium OLB5]|nr:MAG: Competence protein A [Chlorobi bacterium OLB5]